MADEKTFISQLNSADTANDTDIMIIEGEETKKISFLSLFNAIKTKLSLGAAAFLGVANNDTTTTEGYVADARVLKTHRDKINALDNKALSLENKTAELDNDLTSVLTNYVLPLKSDLNDVSELTANRSISFAYYVVNAKNSPNANSYGIVMSYHTSGTSYNQTVFDMNAGAIYVRRLDGAWKQI